MLETLKNAWKIADLRKKILYTLGMLLLYRVLCFIPTPGVDTTVIAQAVEKYDLLGFISSMTGSNLSNFNIMAMGITPYINASIIMQLLCVAIPKLEEMQKEGEEGRKKIAQITRYVTVGLGFIQAIALTIGLHTSATGGFLSYLTIGLCLAAGTAVAMWMGERITENGIGNGISMLIFAGIVSNLVTGLTQYLSSLFTAFAAKTLVQFLASVLVFMILLLGIVFVDLAERRIPVQYSKRMVGRKMYGGQSTHIPLKLNASGVLPLIFAGIISNLVRALSLNIDALIRGQNIGGILPQMIASVVVFLILIVGIVFVDLGERRIPIQYAKRMVGRRMYGGQSTHIPLKLNASGVLPLIFANAIMQFPSTILAFFPNSGANRWWTAHVSSQHLLYQLIFALMIFGFTFFYSEISFNPVEISKNIQANGGMIPGIRQGKPTSDFIKKITRRITMFGAIYLAILAVIPMIIYAIAGVSLPFAASSLLIAVSVAMETMRELESQMLMRHYKGFLQ